MKLMGICGSIREGSYNKCLLLAARDLLRDEASVDLFDIGEIPHYNGDLDGDTKPPAVRDLLSAVAQADALVIATPEYNYGVPGVLKNAIDWASRPAFDSVLKGKPTTILSASMAATGGARAQIQLRGTLAGILTPVFLAPDFALAGAQNAFDESGGLKDDATRKRLREHLGAFLEWARATRS